MVWDRYIIRSLWVIGTRRGSFLSSYANATKFRKGERDLFPARDNLQATTKVWPESRGRHISREVIRRKIIIMWNSASPISFKILRDP